MRGARRHQSKRRRIGERRGESVWSELARRLQLVATRLAHPRPLTVSEDFSGEDHRLVTWVYSPLFDARRSFDEVATEAGKYLGAPGGPDPLLARLIFVSLAPWEKKG